jgi:hypothetical protein
VTASVTAMGPSGDRFRANPWGRRGIRAACRTRSLDVCGGTLDCLRIRQFSARALLAAGRPSLCLHGDPNDRDIGFLRAVSPRRIGLQHRLNAMPVLLYDPQRVLSKSHPCPSTSAFSCAAASVRCALVYASAPSFLRRTEIIVPICDADCHQ